MDFNMFKQQVIDLIGYEPAGMIPIISIPVGDKETRKRLFQIKFTFLGDKVALALELLLPPSECLTFLKDVKKGKNVGTLINSILGE